MIPKRIPTLSLVLVLGVAALIHACGDRGASSAPSASAPLPSSSEPSPHLVLDDPTSDTQTAEANPEPAPVVEDAESLSAPAPELYAEGGLTLRRFALSRRIEDREPIDPAFAFPLEQAPLYAFVDVANATDEARSVRVVFESPSGERVGLVDLDVPNDVSRFRTWAYSRMITEPGPWQAVVETDEGALLGRISFEIEPS